MASSPDSLASLDGSVMLASEVTIPATDEGLIRGDGVFEVIRLYDGRPFALDRHLARLERSATKMNVFALPSATWVYASLVMMPLPP